MGVEVALVILAKLTGGIALSLENCRHGAIGGLPAFLRARQTDLGHARANRDRAADEGGPTRRAALLAVVVGEADAFIRNAVDIRCLVAHHATVVVADVPITDVVTPDDKDVGLLVLCRGGPN